MVDVPPERPEKVAPQGASVLCSAPGLQAGVDGMSCVCFSQQSAVFSPTEPIATKSRSAFGRREELLEEKDDDPFSGERELSS